MKVFISYAIIVVVVVLVTNLISILATFLMFFLRGKKNLLPMYRLMYEAIGAFAAVTAITWIARQSSLRMSYIALMLPFLGIVANGFTRLEAAKDGRSGARRLMAVHGELDAYDQANEIKTERFALAGTFIGYIGGLVACVGKLPLF